MTQIVACLALLGVACATTSPASDAPVVVDNETAAVAAVLDDWHAAAAAADEQRYFAHLAEDAIFMGTDATERWNKKAFQDYAHPHFAKGKAWSFAAIRRAIRISHDGGLAWFDEDLATPNLGPARGSGVLRKSPSGWRIVHYNLSVTIPNERFDAVRSLLAGESDDPTLPR